jgi:hypothetical protein
MDVGVYKVHEVMLQAGDGVGYRLEGPGLLPIRAYCGPEARERLEDLAELLNFAFELGRHRKTSDALGVSPGTVKSEGVEPTSCRGRLPD